MPGPATRLEYLYERLVNDACTPVENAEFWRLLADAEEDHPVKAAVFAEYASVGPQLRREPGEWDRAWSKIIRTAPAARRVSLGRRIAWVAAAACMIAVCWAVYQLQRHPGQVALAPLIAPGGNKATLTLSDGRVIALDSAGNGELSAQGTVRVMKIDSGLLAYHAYARSDAGQGGQGLPNSQSGSSFFNTLTTPRGGQYQLVLPDGTHVWLNAASEITYPTFFNDAQRRVKLKGQAYFEVPANAHAPFIVEAEGAAVTVLGTSFDVMAYTDEASVNTTLINGAVRVGTGKQQLQLKPGEQARMEYRTSRLGMQRVDVQRVIAWKDGLFDFKGADVPTIMRQIARWYDVDIRYNGDLTGVRLSGLISRRSDVAKLLEVLEATEQVHFESKGRTIIVSARK